MVRPAARPFATAALVLTLSVGSSACLQNLLDLFAPSSTTKTSETAAGIRVTAVTAGVDTASFSGSCPKRFTFTGTITASEPGQVTFKWERSDGSATAVETMAFAGAGSQTASNAWDVTKSTTGWQRLHVLTPNDLTSNDARVTMVCQ